MSKIIESLRADLKARHRAGAVSKVTMREFDASAGHTISQQQRMLAGKKGDVVWVTNPW